MGCHRGRLKNTIQEAMTDMTTGEAGTEGTTTGEETVTMAMTGGMEEEGTKPNLHTIKPKGRYTLYMRPFKCSAMFLIDW